jgi:hypothetical protein
MKTCLNWNKYFSKECNIDMSNVRRLLTGLFLAKNIISACIVFICYGSTVANWGNAEEITD